MFEIGDKVTMNNKYYVSEKNRNKIFIVFSKAWNVGDTEVVLLENYNGCYAVDGLDKYVE